MDVDEGESGKSHKRAKANSGAVVAVETRQPRSNRYMAGMRDNVVRVLSIFSLCQRNAEKILYVPAS